MSDPDPLICKFCLGDNKIPYVSQSDLNRHVQLAHRNEHIEQKCEFCEYKTYHYQDLISHLRSEHSDQTPADVLLRNQQTNRSRFKNRKKNKTKSKKRPDPDPNPDEGVFRTAFNGAIQHTG